MKINSNVSDNNESKPKAQINKNNSHLMKNNSNKGNFSENFNNSSINSTLKNYKLKISLENKTEKTKEIRKNKQIFVKDEKTKLYLKHRNLGKIANLKEENRNISHHITFENCLELKKFNFKSFLEVFTLIVMISLFVLF